MSAGQPPPRGPGGTEVMTAFPDMTEPAEPRPAPRAMVAAAPVAVPQTHEPLVADAATRLKGFRREQVYDASAPATALLDDLTHIQQVDERAEWQHRWLSRLRWLTTLPTLVVLVVHVLPNLLRGLDGGYLSELFAQGFIAIFFLMWVPMIAWPWVRQRIFPIIHQPTGDGAGIKALLAIASGALTFLLAGEVIDERQLSPLGIAIVAVGVVILVLARLRRRYDTEDRRYLLAHALVETFSRDIAPREPVALRLDLRPPNIKDKETERRKEGLYNGSARIGRFSDTWLELKGRFLDGTKFQFTMTEQVTIKNVVKGRKNKFKTKTKTKHRAGLTLRTKPGKVRGLEALGRQGRGAMQLDPSVQLKRFAGGTDRLQAEIAFMGRLGDVDASEGKAEEWASDAHRRCVQLCLGLYQVLQAAKTLHKREAA